MATDQSTISDINLISSFLSDPQITDLTRQPNAECIVVCASAVLHGAETIFRGLENGSLHARTLVLVGGIGHSTQLMRDAVSRHPKYHALADSTKSLPEARILELILERWFDVERIKGKGCHVLVEDRSTNCGANASETRKVLEQAAVMPSTVMINQDPTMARRTRASFVRVYEDLEHRPTFLSCPVFVPTMQESESDGGMEYANSDVPTEQLWEPSRFLDLILGRFQD
ncbi:hypothetical protein H2203_002637 [Taxawa tesnikishii (nom. ined.)]|nr:hypothetical protein H2203_002637 [Dothideales sp. JES 119]